MRFPTGDFAVRASARAAGLVLLIAGCGPGLPPPPPPGGQTPLTTVRIDGGTLPLNAGSGARFCSYEIMPAQCSAPSECTKSMANGGWKPRCATSISPYCDNYRCLFAPKGGTCPCYEGQAQACDPATGLHCEAGVACGVQVCIVVDDNNSSWSNTCTPLQ
jgi:hypothetical protein